MVSEFNSGLCGLFPSPGPRRCVVFFSKTLYSHSASLHSRVQIGIGEFNAGVNAAMD